MVFLTALAPELLEEIFSLVSADQQAGKVALAALASTSRTLYPYAFRHIWRVLHSLRPLLNCFPQDLWNRSPSTTESRTRKQGTRLQYKLLRDIRPEDLQHIKKYADAVRVFDMQSWGFWGRSRLPIEVYRKLQAALAPTGKRLLPNVTVVHIDRDLDFTQFLQIFMGTFLRDLSFDISSSKLNDVDLSGCPHIEMLSIRGRASDYPKNLNPAILSRMLCAYELSSLRTLRIDTISTTIVTRLASLPNLQILDVRLVLPEYRDTTPSHLRLSGFSNLQELNFGARTSSDCATFLRDLPPSLPIKTISISPDDGFTSADLTSIMSCIAICCVHNSLETILLVDYGGWLEEPKDGPERGLKNSHIEKLLVFKHLRRLQIDIRDIFDLDDSIVRRMSTTWPDLTELQVETKVDQRLDHNLTLTFNGLRDLAQNCPGLTHLRISVNTEAISEDLYDLEPTTCKLEVLAVVNSPLRLEDTTQVANVLQRIFPSLRRLSCWDDPRFEGESKWGHVRVLLGLPDEDIQATYD